MAKILAEMENLKSTHSDQLRHASDDYNEKIEKLKGLHDREMKLIREELELQVDRTSKIEHFIFPLRLVKMPI